MVKTGIIRIYYKISDAKTKDTKGYSCALGYLRLFFDVNLIFSGFCVMILSMKAG